MYLPRRLFGGACAADACRERDQFLRAMLLHGMGAAPDLEPGEMDDLVALGWAALVEGTKRGDQEAVRNCGRRASLADFGLGRPELFTASLATDRPDGVLHAFVALMAVDEADASRRLRERLGHLADQAVLRRGFDPSEPIGASLLSDSVEYILKDGGAEAGSALARGLDVFLQAGFEN